MKRTVSLLFLAVPLVLSACGKPEVTVQAELVQEGSPQPVAVGDLPVRLLPYDRDAILDSLTRKAKRPEPTLPADIQLQRDSLARLQVVWRAANARLRAIADTSATLTVQVRPGAAAMAEREQKMRQAQRLGLEQQQVNQQVGALQDQIDQLSRRIDARLDSVRTARQEWAATALKDFDRIVQDRIDDLGRSEVVDTTSASGTVTFRVDKGRWWVYARYALPDAELYWNFPVEVTADRTLVQLNEQNAKRRPF